MRPAYVVPFTLIVACAVPDDEAAPQGTGTDTDWTDDPPGCINVDGAGDFETIGSAVAAAPDAANVYVCGGTWELEEDEEIVIDRPMAILGEDPSTTIIKPPVNQHGFEVSASGVTISGFTIEKATRSGVALVDASEVVIDNMVFDKVENWGVEAEDSTASITNSTFIKPKFGGVSVAGGNVSVADSSFDQPYGYGVYAVNDAEVTLTGNSFSGVTSIATQGSLDGVAIYADGATVAMSNNVLDSPDIVGVYGLDATLSLDGDVVLGAPYGILAENASLTAVGATITDATQLGVYAVTPYPVALDGLTITIAAGGSCSLAYADWGTEESGAGCGGALLVADEVSVTGTTISGYENYSLYATGYAAEAAITLTDSTFQDSGRTGVQLRLNGGTATLNGVRVTGVREMEEESTCGVSVYQGSGLFVYDGAADITGSSFTENVAWGVSSIGASVTLTGSTIRGNACAGVVDLSGLVVATGNTFSSGAYHGTVHQESGVLLASGNTFVDIGDYTLPLEEVVDGVVKRTEYDNASWAIVTYGNAEVEITDNSFDRGDNAIFLSGTPGVVSDNSFDNFHANILYVSSNDADDPVIFSENTVGVAGGYVVYAGQAFVEVEDVTVDAVTGYVSAYRQYLGDILSSESYSSYTYPVFQAYGYAYSYVDSTTGEEVLYEYPGGIRIADSSVGTAVWSVLSASGARIEVDGLTAESAGAGVFGSWGEETVDFHVANVSLGTVEQYGFQFIAESGEDAYPTITNVSVDEVTDGYGIWLDGLKTITVDGATIGATGAVGLRLSGVYTTSEYDASLGYYVSVDYSNQTQANIDGLTIENADSDGIDFSDGSLTLTNSTIRSSTSDGLELTDATADIQGNTLTGNQGYGMTCDTVTLAACTGNDLSDNVLGPHSGCDDACGI